MQEQQDAGSPARGPSRERVAASALHQSVRHERAVGACLTELAGAEWPGDPIAEAIWQRALRHARRAVELARTAIRISRDPLAEPLLAAMLERHERTLKRVEEWTPAGELAGLPRAV